MASEWIRFIICACFLIGGIFVVCVGVLGTYRFKFVLNRMHAAGIVDTLGILLCSLGLIVAQGFTVESLKLILTVVILWCTSPVSSHLIGRLVVATEEKKEDYMEVHR